LVSWDRGVEKLNSLGDTIMRLARNKREEEEDETELEEEKRGDLSREKEWAPRCKRHQSPLTLLGRGEGEREWRAVKDSLSCL